MRKDFQKTVINILKFLEMKKLILINVYLLVGFPQRALL